MFKSRFKKILLITGMIVAFIIASFVKVKPVDSKLAAPKLVLSSNQTDYVPLVKQVIIFTSKIIIDKLRQH